MGKKRIFASYQFTTKKQGQGLGRIIVTLDRKIEYDKDVVELERIIKEEMEENKRELGEIDNIVLLNWRTIKEYKGE